MKRSLVALILAVILFFSYFNYDYCYVAANNEIESQQLDTSNNLTTVQKNTLAMLNHVVMLSYQIEEHKNNRLYLDDIYSSIINNIYPNAIQGETENYLSKLLKTIDKYKMLDVKRERLEFIYEQKQAQAMRSAVPNPIGLLSAVSSGDPIKAIASIIYMGIDSVTGYQGAIDSANMEYIQNGWELDDESQRVMEENVEDTWRYTNSITNTYDIPGEFTLSQYNVQKFADVCNENEEGTTSQIQYLEDNVSTYENYPDYWAILAEYYYNRTIHEDINHKPSDKDIKYYKKCLNAIDKYEETQAHIFRDDHTLTRIFPMGLVSASHVYSEKEYIAKAYYYIEKIKDNLVDEDWAIRYFVAQTELDLFRRTKDKSLLVDAYSLTRQNVNILKKKQVELNNAYITDIDNLKAKYDKKKDSKQKIDEAKAYNDLLKETRKTELPPIYEPLRLNCELLFSLASYMNKTEEEMEWDNDILHKGGEPLFYVSTIDSHYWYKNEKNSIPKSGEIVFNEGEISIPARYLTSAAVISVSVDGANGKQSFDDWVIREVDRKKSSNVNDFVATYKSKKMSKYDYSNGDKIIITIDPMKGSNYQLFECEYKVSVTTRAKVIRNVKYELVR